MKINGKKVVLDEYEQQLEREIENGEWIPLPKKEFEKELRELQEAAGNYFKDEKAGKLKLSK